MNAPLPPALLDEALDRLHANWATWFPGSRRPRRLSYTVQGTGVGKLIVFVLPDGAQRPACVVKIPRSVRDNASLADEYALISELRRRGGAVAEASLPGPVAAPVIQGWQVVVEQMLPGSLFSREVPVGERFSLELAAQHLRLVREWYVALQRAVYPELARLGPADIDTLFREPIAAAQRDAELRPHERQYLDTLADDAAALEGRWLRVGFVHGDLRPGNILLHQGQLRVLDWQFGAYLRGLPMLDWFEFAYRYYCDACDLAEITGDHDAYRAAFADAFLGAHPYARLLATETRACAEALDVPLDHLDMLLTMWLVDNTNKYLRFLTDRAEHGYLYLMQNPPGGPFRSFRQQLRRQVYPCLLGQMAQSRGSAARAHSQANGLHSVEFPIS